MEYKKGDKIFLKPPKDWLNKGPGINGSMRMFAVENLGKELTINYISSDTHYFKIREDEGNWWFGPEWAIKVPERSKEEQLLIKIQQLWERQPFIKERVNEI